MASARAFDFVDQFEREMAFWRELEFVAYSRSRSSLDDGALTAHINGNVPWLNVQVLPVVKVTDFQCFELYSRTVRLSLVNAKTKPVKDTLSLTIQCCNISWVVERLTWYRANRVCEKRWQQDHAGDAQIRGQPRYVVINTWSTSVGYRQLATDTNPITPFVYTIAPPRKRASRARNSRATTITRSEHDDHSPPKRVYRRRAVPSSSSRSSSRSSSSSSSSRFIASADVPLIPLTDKSPDESANNASTLTSTTFVVFDAPPIPFTVMPHHVVEFDIETMLAGHSINHSSDHQCDIQPQQEMVAMMGEHCCDAVSETMVSTAAIENNIMVDELDRMFDKSFSNDDILDMLGDFFPTNNLCRPPMLSAGFPTGNCAKET